MQGFAYFPTIIYRIELPQLVEESQASAEDFYFDSVNNGDIVVQTSNMTEDPRVKDLIRLIQKTAKGVLDAQGYDTSAVRLKVSDLWAQKMEYSGSNVLHVHANKLLSGFYFLEVPEKSGYPLFCDPRAGKLMSDLPLKQSSDIAPATPFIHFDNVMRGTMLIFNSWLGHSMTFHGSPDPLKFIHFNVKQI